MLDLTDWQNRGYTTRDGQSVRLLCIDGPGRCRIIGLVGENLIRWSSSGQYNKIISGEDDLDLINAKTKREGWINVYRAQTGIVAANSSDVHHTMERADSVARPDRLACIKIEWEE